MNADTRSPIEILLRDEIARSGPISFERFMDLALYHPEFGYYRRSRDPFGVHGDYYTAEQLQPVFGVLIARALRSFKRELGDPENFTVLELGAGRKEMIEAFQGFRYIPLDAGQTDWPERLTGVVFANEFFDALPVRRFVRQGNNYVESLVAWDDVHGFHFIDGAVAAGGALAYLNRYAASRDVVEWSHAALKLIPEIARRIDRGFLAAIDYGYTAADAARFPEGTLMSYHRHRAIEHVLANPGEQDITAHVAFDALVDEAEKNGMRRVRLESLAQFLLRAGEEDQFAETLRARDPRDADWRRLQLKTLLFSMGEIFRVLTLRKHEETKKGPDESGPLHEP